MKIGKNIAKQNAITSDNLETMESVEIRNAHTNRLIQLVKFCRGVLADGDSILDVGCRTGMLLSILEKQGKFALFGVDCSSQAVSLVPKKYDCSVMDACNLSFTDNKFDVIMMSHVLEHFPNVPRVVNEVDRVLSPSGCVIIEVPIEEKSTVPTKWGHYQFFQSVEDVLGVWPGYKVMSTKIDPRKKWMRLAITRE